MMANQRRAQAERENEQADEESSPDSEEEKSNEMVEYELESLASQEAGKYNYDMSGEYLNPIVIKQPNGTI